jgi:nitrite reductase/ring-hydroxylating ferredoxin subunit/metal-sulfur cluster biosynthetic enzyme
MSEGFVKVASVGEIPMGGLKEVRLEDRTLAIFHLDDGYYAIEDVCTHDGGPLAEGILEGDIIECPRHGARFDLKTGAVLSLPAVTPVPTFEVRVVGEEIQVKWPVDPAGAATPSATMPAARSPAAPVTAPAPAAATPAATPAPAAATTEATSAPAAAAPTSSAPSQQEMAVRSALETVMDPEIGLSVIDLGLIRTVDVQPGRTRVDMLLTTPFCPYAPQMIADVKQAAQSVVPQDCDVEILPDAWSPEMMPDPSLLGFSY